MSRGGEKRLAPKGDTNFSILSLRPLLGDTLFRQIDGTPAVRGAASTMTATWRCSPGSNGRRRDIGTAVGPPTRPGQNPRPFRRSCGARIRWTWLDDQAIGPYRDPLAPAGLREDRGRAQSRRPAPREGGRAGPGNVISSRKPSLRGDAFHSYISEIRDLPRLWKAIEISKAQLDRCRHLTVPKPGLREATLVQHRNILNALVQKDRALSRRMMTEHLDKVYDGIVRFLVSTHSG